VLSTACLLCLICVSQAHTISEVVDLITEIMSFCRQFTEKDIMNAGRDLIAVLCGQGGLRYTLPLCCRRCATMIHLHQGSGMDHLIRVWKSALKTFVFCLL
jgi:hypothetical protein